MRFHQRILAALSCLLLASCGIFGSKSIPLPSTPILSGGSGWAIVKSSYVRLKETPSEGSKDLAALRDGSLVEIIGREFDTRGISLWYEVATREKDPDSEDGRLKGWVPENEVDIYASREQAERSLAIRKGK